MTSSRHKFDPYHKWFGIPAHEQPPNHYRLLRIARFESDAEVIENAYEKEMADLKTQEHGQYGDLVESISRELIAAHRCLLDPGKKEAYDSELRAKGKSDADRQAFTLEQADSITIDQAVRTATTGLIDERNRLTALAMQASARERQALLEVDQLRTELQQLRVAVAQANTRLNVPEPGAEIELPKAIAAPHVDEETVPNTRRLLVPLKTVDHLLANLAGDGNALLHQFLRIVAVMTLIAILLGMFVLAGGGAKNQRLSETASPEPTSRQATPQQVQPRNISPELPVLSDRTVIAGNEVAIIVEAHDADDEDGDLRFSLSDEPAGAAIDAITGQFRWTPADAQAGQQHRVTVRVEDDGTPPGSDEKSFLVTVTDPIIGTRAGQERGGNGLKMKFCWCPPGKFTMGSPTGETGRFSNEKQVPVGLTRGYWLGKYEVTQDHWAQVMRTKPWNGETGVKEGADYPATFVSWDDAIEFCKKLTEQERRAGRLSADWQYTLPTEAQWEYACRAGSTTRFSFGDDESRLGGFAWFVENAFYEREHYAHQVGVKKPNAWGLHDMHGNVWEWCRDWYMDELPGGTNPEVTSTGSTLVRRGGSWDTSPVNCRSAGRSRVWSGYRINSRGFRVAAVPSSD